MRRAFTAMGIVGLAGLVGLVGLVAACSGGDPNDARFAGAAPAESASADGMIPRADVERDLVVETTRATTEPMDHERDPGLEVWLVNRSATTSYPVVLSNDGSESGWREPHAYLTTELLRASGQWEPAPKLVGGRCGLYAVDWEKDVMTLAPGARVKMPWMYYPAGELGDATRVRITAHYEHGAHARDKSKVPPVLHAMPEYALKSAPVEIPVEHPYRLSVAIKGPLPKTPQAPLNGALEVTLENRSSRPLPFGTSESGAQLWFEIQRAEDPAAADEEGDSSGYHSLFVDTVPTYPSKGTIAPGARQLVTTSASKTDVIWELPATKITKIRALWRIWDGPDREGAPHNVRRVESPWVDVH